MASSIIRAHSILNITFSISLITRWLHGFPRLAMQYLAGSTYIQRPTCMLFALDSEVFFAALKMPATCWIMSGMNHDYGYCQEARRSTFIVSSIIPVNGMKIEISSHQIIWLQNVSLANFALASRIRTLDSDFGSRSSSVSTKRGL